MHLVAPTRAWPAATVTGRAALRRCRRAPVWAASRTAAPTPPSSHRRLRRTLQEHLRRGAWA